MKIDGTEEPTDDDLAEAETLRKELEDAANDDSNAKRIDDPVRMYLSQMGSIPLLTRDEEIRLAKKIEMARMLFRRRCLESDHVVMQASEILRQVMTGEMPFDRTMRISTAEANAEGEGHQADSRQSGHHRQAAGPEPGGLGRT